MASVIDKNGHLKISNFMSSQGMALETVIGRKIDVPIHSIVLSRNEKNRRLTCHDDG